MLSAQVRQNAAPQRSHSTFYQTPIGKKFVMAVSGCILYLYILGL